MPRTKTKTKKGTVAVIRTDTGNYNVIGTRNNSFVLQGNVNEAELRLLMEQCQARLGEVARGEATS